MNRSTVYAPNGVVAASQPLAAAAGLAVLQQGHNAFDASVTMAAVLNVVEPMMTGVGGDMFALFWCAEEERLVGLNASGRAGSLATRQELLRRGHEQMPSTGAETVTVPGALRGWDMLLDHYGTISLDEALQPAIEIADRGFPVSPKLTEIWWQGMENLLAIDEGARSTFLFDGKRTPKAGEWIRNPDLAKTLRLIATEGVDEFYNGEIAERMVKRLRELGGFLSKEDLASNTADWVEPLCVPYHGFHVWELPPNGQGIAVLEMLRILGEYDLKSMGHNSANYLHHLIEANKLAIADLERFVGDPDHTELDLAYLLGDEFIRARRLQLDPQNAASQSRHGNVLESSETTYFTTADSDGNMVSFINSLASAFGSGVVIPGTGFALQNRGSGFTLDNDHANTLAPGKRPFHTIIPAFVTRDDEHRQSQPWVSLGVMGGTMQPQGQVQVLLNLIDFDMEPQQALDSARFRHLEGGKLAVESMVPQAVLDQLSSFGHELADPSRVFFGGGQIIMRLDRGWAAGSETRMDGLAVGC